LAPIRERLYRETVGRYGFRKEFARADAETMMEVLKEIKKRSVSNGLLVVVVVCVCVCVSFIFSLPNYLVTGSTKVSILHIVEMWSLRNLMAFILINKLTN
jgi:cytochrome c-type biogenesis protein CcmH/NrfG